MTEALKTQATFLAIAAFWIAVGLPNGAWALFGYQAASIVVVSRAMLKIRRIKRHPLYYLVALQNELGKE